MNRLYKGRTNNHVTFGMVGSADFATPYSAASAATKIKIYGKLRGATGVNFVTSGTGSLTNDIGHVGASALGLYTIALAKADLSDASAAWYDTYIVSLSCTGCAYNALVCEGVIDESTLMSRVLLTQSAASDAASAAQQTNSRVLLNKSAISDIQSYLVAMSGLDSDIQSAVAVGNSRILLNQSRISDVASFLVVMSGIKSDIYSLLSNVNSGVGSAPTLTQMASAVWANTIGARVDSRVLVGQSYLSDIRSHLSDIQSDFQSRVPKRVATDSQLSDMASDIKSYLVALSGLVSDVQSAVAAGAGTVTVSNISDIASAVDAILASRLSDILSAAVQANSRALVIQSMVSDTQSKLSDVESNLLSVIGTTGVQLNASSLSDLRSAITGATFTLGASDMSDIASRVWAETAATTLTSRMLVAKSSLSDIYSLLSDVQSDFQSRVPKRVATDSQLSDLASDIKSAVSAGGLTTLASDMSDTLSGVRQANSRLLVAQSMLSDVQSAVAVIPATKLAAHAAGVLALVVGSGSTTVTVKLSTVEGGAPSAVSDFYKGRVIVFTSGALSGQATSISSYDGASTTATVVALTGAPANAVTAVIC